MEGRAQTLNYVRTLHRFELTLSDPIIIGYRRGPLRRSHTRVAQRLRDDCGTAAGRLPLHDGCRCGMAAAARRLPLRHGCGSHAAPRLPFCSALPADTL
jgi:hypothetical protein